MYLGTALKMAIPFAILDREDMARVHGYEGPAAKEASQACADLRALAGIKTANFSAAQKETARLALCWAEQYLYGYVDAQAHVNNSEAKKSHKQMNQIRKVRVDHFGLTANEASSARCTAVPIGSDKAHAALLRMLRDVVVCPSCDTRTNSRVEGEVCSTCKKGVFRLERNTTTARTESTPRAMPQMCDSEQISQ